MPIDFAEAMQLAKDAACAGGQAAMAYFERDMAVTRKADETPVTAADKAAETAILEVIGERFPEHDILSEESEPTQRGSAYRWIIDPLDGTKSFVRGLPFWGPLVALEEAGRVVASAVAMPVLGEVYWAGRGLGCHGPRGACRVSRVTELAAATLSLGEIPRLLREPRAPGLTALIQAAENVRCFGDVAAPVLLVSGRADIWVEGGVKHWDLAAHQLLIEEAGGRFTDFQGVATPTSGMALGTNDALHATALATLTSAT